MRIGIIKYDNNDYYIDLSNNKLNVKKITNKEATSISKDEFISLIKELFDSNFTYKTKVYDYEIYIDEVGNQRFFKDGKEELKLFFVANGETALLYSNTNNTSENSPKMFEIKTKRGKVAFILSFITLFSIVGTDSMLKTYDVMRYERTNNLSQTIENIDLNYNDIKEGLSHLELNYKELEYLSNEELIGDVLSIYSDKQKYIVKDKLDYIKYYYFTEAEKVEKENCTGYYDLLRNKISLRDESKKTFFDTMPHEFIHFLQDNNRYSYIKEACASLLSHEYYGTGLSYPNEVKNVKFLMELIGPQPILECNFKADTSSFENKIHEVLNPEDANELLQIFSSLAKDDSAQAQKSEALDRLFNNMCNNIYGHDIKDDKYLSFLKENELKDRIYFNKHDDKINKKIIINRERCNEYEINIEDADKFNCTEIKKIITEEQTGDNVINYKYSQQKAMTTYMQYERFLDVYNTNLKNKDQNTKYYYSIVPKNSFDDIQFIMVYGKENENGVLKFYTDENITYLQTIPEKFPKQFRKTSKVDSLFTTNNDNEAKVEHTR